MKKAVKRIVVFLMIFAMAFTVGVGSYAKASATTGTDIADDILTMVSQFEENYFELTDEQEQYYSSNLEIDIQEESLTPNVNDSIQLDFDNIKLSGYSAENGNEYVVSVPLKGDVEKGSTFTAVYDESGNIVRTMEYQFSNLDGETGKANIWYDGTLILDQNLT